MTALLEYSGSLACESQEYCHEFIKICKNKLPMLCKLKNLSYELIENKRGAVAQW